MNSSAPGSDKKEDRFIYLKLLRKGKSAAVFIFVLQMAL